MIDQGHGGVVSGMLFLARQLLVALDHLPKAQALHIHPDYYTSPLKISLFQGITMKTLNNPTVIVTDTGLIL